MFRERDRRWVRRTARGLVCVMALWPIGVLPAETTPDEAPPAPPPPVAPPPPAPAPSPGPAPGNPPPSSPPPSSRPPTARPPTVGPSTGTTTSPAVLPSGPAAPATTGPLPREYQNLLIFPLDIDEPAQSAPPEIVATIPDRIASALNQAHAANAVVFYRGSPLIQRALRERRLTDAMVGTNIPDTAVPLIAREYQASRIIRGSVSAYTFDRAANRVEISLALDLRDLSVAGGKSQLIAVTGDSRPAPVVSGELALAAEAANDVALKAAAALAGMTPEALTQAAAAAATPVVVKKPNKRRGRAFAIVAGLALVVAILASQHGSGGSSNPVTTTSGTTTAGTTTTGTTTTGTTTTGTTTTGTTTAGTTTTGTATAGTTTTGTTTTGTTTSGTTTSGTTTSGTTTSGGTPPSTPNI